MSLSSSELFAARWSAHLHRDADGAPLVSPWFVLGQGSGVSIVDLRSPAEAVHALGYIPGTVFMNDETVARELPRDEPVVFVSKTGKEAAQAALMLERAGRPHSAAMAGGLVAWRQLGLITSRDPAGVREQPYTVDATQNDGISCAQVERHIGDPRNVRWIKLASMVSFGHFSCIDGRDERGVVGSLGGDAGEFLLALAALERGTESVLDEEAVAQTLVAHIDAFGGFYMHSDVHAFDRLVAALRDDPKLIAFAGQLDRREDSVKFLRYPEPSVREALLEHLVEPDHVGCGHLRLMLQHGDEYGIRRGLVVSFIQAFFRRWWDGLPELRLTLLPGEHEEAAVVNIRLEEEVWGPMPIPLVSPACGGRQMFVNHPDVTSYLRETITRFHLNGLGGVAVPADRGEDLRASYEQLGVQQLKATLGHLAKGLPIYDAMFARDGSFTVRTV